MSLVLGIDTSTTATKAILVDAEGTVVATGAAEYGYDTPRPLWSEQDPASWVAATEHAVAQALRAAGVDGGQVEAVGLTGQMHGLVLLDERDRVVRPAILWNDQRTGAECDEIRDRVGRDRLIEVTGNDALTGFTAPKLLWVRNHEPEHYRRAAAVLLPKDHVRLALTGEHATDAAGGSGTVLFDLGARTWSPEILDLLDLPAEWFPPVHEGPAVTGAVSAAAAEATGLREGTPVVAGGGDQAAAAVGVGAVASGTLSLSLGTSGVVFAPTDAKAVEPNGRLHAFCHAVPGRWHLMGVMLSAAGSLRWFRDTFMPDASFDEVTARAAAAPPGADGLLFLPYLTGERTPHPDPLARGAFVGLTVRHELAHLARAVLEGVAFGLRDALHLVKSAAPAVEAVHVTGGGARSAVWRQIVADILEEPLMTVDAGEGAAYGAAILAAVGAGWAPSVEQQVAAWVEPRPAETPSGSWDVEAAHGRYRELYPALASSFAAAGGAEA